MAFIAPEPLALFENPNDDAISAYRDAIEQHLKDEIRFQRERKEVLERKQLAALAEKYGVKCCPQT